MPPFSSPAFDRYSIVHRITRAIDLRFHHGFAIHHLLTQALDHHPGRYVLPFVHEMGKTHYEPGDLYRWELTLIGSKRPLAGPIERSLRQGCPKSAGRMGRGTTLAESVELVRFDKRPAPDRDRELEPLRSFDTLRLRFLSPLLHEREHPTRSDQRYFDVHHFEASFFLRKLALRLAWLDRREPALETPGDPTGATADASRMLWLLVPSGEGGGRVGHPLRGLIGEVDLRGVPEPWLPVLVAGQYLRSAGQKQNFGFNVYSIAGIPSRVVRRPAVYLLKQFAQLERLEQAFEHVRSRSEAAGVDRVSPAAFGKQRLRRLRALSSSLLDGTYKPSPLLGVLAKKKGGGTRALSIPTVTDRVAQRAALELLQPAVETLFEDCSHAYRRDFSRHGAAEEIQRAARDGFEFILDADITAFFDQVDRDRLFQKWEALFPGEPLNQLMQSWVEAPVIYRGKRLRRYRGLPQGSPISPLLANLYLDELDEELLGDNYRLIRYADDFVVCCRSLEEVHRAQDDVRRTLARLGLRLNPRKTAIRELAHGFDFLGFRFEGTEFEDLSARAERIPEVWLDAAPLEEIHQIVQSGVEKELRDIQVVPLRATAARPESTGRPLYVSHPAASLRLRDDRLDISVESASFSYPIRDLSHVVFLGRVRATVPLILRLHRHGIPCFMCRADGRIETVFDPFQPAWPLWMAQADCARDAERKLVFAQAVVSARLHNLAVTLVRLRFPEARTSAAKIRDLERSTRASQSLEALRGFEGHGASVFLAAWRKSLSGFWSFSRRSRQPPRDPFNALLSFVYTLLFNHAVTAVLAAGLNPRIGLYHEGRGRHEALASDLIEEFRHLAERLVSQLIRKHEVRPEHFSASVSEVPLLTVQGRNRVIDSFEAMMGRQVSHPREEGVLSYAEILAKQARALREFVRGELDSYAPFRSRN